MNIAATNPPTSPTMPPPKAISSDPRSPPARTISRVSRSTLLTVLCCFARRKKQRHRRLCKRPQKRLSDHSAQISGDVSTNTRRGSRPTARSIRGASVSSNPLPANTSYFAEGVSTRIVCTMLSMIEEQRGEFGARLFATNSGELPCAANLPSLSLPF